MSAEDGKYSGKDRSISHHITYIFSTATNSIQ